MGRYGEYADPEEVEEYENKRLGLTYSGILWAAEIERRYAEGDSIEFIAHELGIKPWQIQLLMVQASME